MVEGKGLMDKTSNGTSFCDIQLMWFRLSLITVVARQLLDNMERGVTG